LETGNATKSSIEYFYAIHQKHFSISCKASYSRMNGHFLFSSKVVA